jgi:photosystem II stability/assembly factor-like uncharacterized protein
MPRIIAQAGGYAQLTINTHGEAIVQILPASNRGAGVLLLTQDAGQHWSRRPVPSWDGHQCFPSPLMTAYRPQTWLLCIGGAAAGSSTKGLMRSTDGGKTWSTMSAVVSLTQRPRTGSLPLMEPSALAAGSRSRLWLALINSLAESDDGGRRWATLPGVNLGGGRSTLAALNSTHAWLLAPGAGLWRTTNGLRWTAIGPLNPR